MAKLETPSIEALTRLIEQIPPDEIARALAPTARINLRMTPSEKTRIDEDAEALGLTVNAYVTRVLALVGRKRREG